MAFNAKGGEPAEATEWHPYLNPCVWTTVDIPSAERHPQSDPSEKLTKEVLVPGGWTTKNPYCHPELDSGSGQRCELPLTLDRFRIKYGMTLKKVPMVCGFTMAEILLSLTIIGVVAAITLPSLTGNINERTWNTQRKALYARFSQAIVLMPALNGYGTLTEGDSSTSAVDTAAETFVTSGLAKVLKINNICDSEHLEDCGIPSKIIAMSGSIAFSETPKTLVAFNNMFNGSYIDSANNWSYEYSQIDTKAAAFETANGESILTYYNPQCKANMNEMTSYYAQSKICANFVYDLNGTKGPNTVGKDIGFITAIYPTDSIVVAPLPLIHNVLGNNQLLASKECKKLDDDSRLPNLEEGMALFTNVKLTGMKTDAFWTSTRLASDISKGWVFSTTTGMIYLYPLTTGFNVWCIRR